MKNCYINIIIVLLFCCLLIPFGAFPSGESKPETGQNTTSSGKFNVLIEQTGKTLQLSKEEYIAGVLFAEISPESNPEAIKAQAVAAYTFACYKKGNSKNNYDISDNYATGQGYMTENAAKEKFGEKYDQYRQIFVSAIKDTQNYIICYNGEVINAMYHAVSAGKTDTAANAFGVETPYLISVESVGDLLSPQYLSTKTLTVNEFKSIVASSGKPTVESPLFGESNKSESGYINRINLMGTNYSGSEVRDLFSLNSSNFDISQDGDSITFTVRGKGHGVGMSQYGANYMASLGSTFVEILSRYYPGCELITQ